jgi:hypothetical protein
MSETTAEPHVNGTAPAPADEAPCEDCPTRSDRFLAVLVGLLGLFVIAMAIDMATGGKVGGMIRERAVE